MVPFEQHLLEIAKAIKISDEDRPVYLADFHLVRDHITKAMCAVDDDFKAVFKGCSLFGSYSNNVRILKPNEFDIILELSFPFGSANRLIPDPDRPGFVFVNFKEVQKKAVDNNNDMCELLNTLVDWDNFYVRATNLKQWLNSIIENALERYGRCVLGSKGDKYVLKYSNRAVAHNVFASCEAREFSIDIVPALVFRSEFPHHRSYPPFWNYNRKWMVCPKKTKDGPEATKKYSFMLINPKAEHDLLLKKDHLKVVFRLLKSLGKQYELRRFKGYMLTTAFLWVIRRKQKNINFWQKPVNEIFIYMLEKLLEYFTCGRIPFFWSREYNLLEKCSKTELAEHAHKLNQAYQTLKSYKYQPNLGFQTCAQHFKMP